MATSGEMIAIVANALALPEATVGSYHRVLRETGLVRKGGRGRSAATMSAGDVAKLLITLLASDCLDDAEAACRLLCDAMFSGADGEPERSASSHADAEPMSLLEAVVILLDQIQQKKLASRERVTRLPLIGDASEDEVVLEVSASLLEARITSRDTVLPFQHIGEPYPITYPDDWMSLPAEERLLARSQIGGMLIRRSVDSTVLAEVADALPRSSTRTD